MRPSHRRDRQHGREDRDDPERLRQGQPFSQKEHAHRDDRRTVGGRDDRVEPGADPVQPHQEKRVGDADAGDPAHDEDCVSLPSGGMGDRFRGSGLQRDHPGEGEEREADQDLEDVERERRDRFSGLPKDDDRECPANGRGERKNLTQVRHRSCLVLG